MSRGMMLFGRAPAEEGDDDTAAGTLSPAPFLSADMVTSIDSQQQSCEVEPPTARPRKERLLKYIGSRARSCPCQSSELKTKKKVKYFFCEFFFDGDFSPTRNHALPV